MTKFSPVLVAIAACLGIAQPNGAEATTIEMFSFASVTPGLGFPQSAPASFEEAIANETTYGSTRGRAAQFVPQVFVEGIPNVSPSFFQPGWFNEADYAATADAVTGQMRFFLNGYYQDFCEGVPPNTCGGGSYWAYSLTSISETFRVSGTGTLRSVMQVDALWSSPQYSFVADLGLYSGSLFDTASVNFATGGLSVAINGSEDGTSVDRLLSAEIQIEDADALEVTATWRMFGDISAVGINDGPSVRGFLNASNTATFFVFASEGLTITPSNAAFLSAPAFFDEPAPVIPVPAALPLLMTALAAFGGIAIARRKV